MESKLEVILSAKDHRFFSNEQLKKIMDNLNRVEPIEHELVSWIKESSLGITTQAGVIFILKSIWKYNGTAVINLDIDNPKNNELVLK